MMMCNCKCSCSVYAFLASLVIGIVTAFLRITGTITVTPAFLWVLLGIAVVFLLVLLGTSFLKSGIFAQSCQSCACKNGAVTTILAGILGTVLVSVILLAITFVVTSVIGAILTGLLLLFFSLIITASACVISQCCD